MLYNKKHIYLRAPLRISFVGGGTDIETFYNDGNTGHVVSSTIDLFCYVAIKDMFDSNTRVHHAEIETESISSRVKHAYSRIALEYFGLFKGIEVVITSDIMTTGSGLGASSAIMSALILGCKMFRENSKIEPYELAELTYALEKEAGTVGGKQDQYAIAFGGFNSITFTKDKINVQKIKISTDNKIQLEESLFLVYTNITRDSKNIQLNLIKNAESKKKKYLEEIRGLSFEFLKAIESNNFNLDELGKILDYGWKLKKMSNEKSTNVYIDQLYEILKSKGVIGGKILGAGGGGFLLLMARDKNIKEKIKYELYPNFISLDVKFWEKGSEVLWKNF